MPTLETWQADAISKYLESCTVTENRFVASWEKTVEETLCKKIRATKPFGDLLSESDVLDVVIRRINLLTPTLPPDYLGGLSDAPNGKEFIAEAQNNLVQYFETLPRSYFVYFPLQNMPPLGKDELRVTDTLSIIDTGVSTVDTSSFIDSNNQLVSALMGIPQPRLEKNTRYVRVKVDGYANASLNSAVASSSFAQVKHWAFASMFRGVLSEVPRFGRKPLVLPTVIRHEVDDATERFAIQIPEEFGRFLVRLSPNFDVLRYYDTSGGGLLGVETRLPDTPSELHIAIQTQYGRSAEFLATPRENPDIERIKAAIEWWIDGAVSENQTIAFLQFCLGFEALLGDPGEGSGGPSERGITDRLSDRYAYIRGQTQSERQLHRAAFKKMYKRRSDIVHQRETRLRRPEDAEACSSARQMLFMAIAGELAGFLKAQEQ